MKKRSSVVPLKCRVKVSAALANKGGYHLMLRIGDDVCWSTMETDCI